MQRQLERSRERETALTRQAQELESEVSRLRHEMIQAARAAQEHEALLSRLEGRLDDLQADAAAREEALQSRRRQMIGTLAALTRLSRNPPEALLLAPGEPIDALRGAILLRAAVPALQDRAQTLRGEIAGLIRVRADITAQLDEYKATNAALASERKRIERLFQQKAALQKQTETEQRRASRRSDDLARQAEDLRELFARLDANRPVPPPPAPRDRERASGDASGTAPERQIALNPPPQPKPESLRPFPSEGPVTTPAQGRIVVRYGESAGLGSTAKGITFETRSGAQIVAPHDGKIVFAGPFRGYGHILIIEHSGGYHTLLAGLVRVDGIVGQWLLAGEPVGIMGQSDGGMPRLYVELRRNGQPINPLPWFAAGNSKVRG